MPTGSTSTGGPDYSVPHAAERAEFLRLDCALRGRSGVGEPQPALGDRWRQLLLILPEDWTGRGDVQ